ncbi:MAG TPA: tetratricopeptide repeat protein [Stellaceae bacterium]|nr:tetratricopeptide repeat protein [Stellaceae bacterium]
MSDIAALLQQAFAAYDRGDRSETERLCRAVIDADPGHFDAHHLLAVVQTRLGGEHEALASYDRALAIRPDDVQALSNRSVALDGLGRLDEALAGFDRALAIRPDYPPALANRGNTLRALKRFADAEASYDAALALQPEFPDCRFNRALLLLLLGRFAEGWREYEGRRQIRTWVPQNFAAPEWQGDDPRGKRLLLYAEQGLGDTIQFSRFTRVLATRGAEVMLRVPPPLAGLMRSLDGVAAVLTEGEAPPAIDCHLPLMSVPFRLRLDDTQIPGDVPYLKADPARVAAWATRLPEAPFRVGIAWQGNPRRQIDRGRSIPLRAFAPLGRIPGVRLISLQKHDGVEQLADLPPSMRVDSLGENFDAGPDGFLDSAAVMMHLDLVVTSDNTVAHLAGALGRKVWVVLQDVPDWRWLLERADTPWYPTARLFRQDRRGDWDEVMARVAGEVATIAEEKTQQAAPPVMNTPPATPADPAPTPATAALALAAYERGELDEAERLCRAVIAAEPNNFDAHHLLAVIHARHGRHGDALASYGRALAVRPDDPQALSNRGATLDALGHYDDALASFDRALAIRPDYPPALSNRGNALRALKRPAEALASYDRALAIRPDFAEALSNRGTALHEMQRHAEALASYDKALALQPDHTHALSNRGLALHALKRPAEALASYDKALRLQPDYADCHCNRALTLFLLGCFGEGWQEYEWRRKTRAWAPRNLAAPEWQGEALLGKRLLLCAEQGLGDTVQFARFAPVLAERGAEVILEVQPPLAGLMQTLDGVRQVVRQGERLPEIDCHLPLLSVPFVLGLDEAQIPAAVPYLKAEPARVEAWAKRLPKGEFRIGIAWQGNPRGDIDRGRSIPLSAFAPLTRVPGVKLISLQKHAGTEQLADLPSGMAVAELGDDFDAGPDGFLDSAAVMMHLDLIVASDSTIAHLAGALGRTVWIALKEVPECRWMMGRADTPWYPTARLFRQTRSGDWGDVFARVADAVQRLRAGETDAAARRPAAIGAEDAAPPPAAGKTRRRETIPAYVISLARRPDRRERFFRWNANKGFDIAVFDAVDGQKLRRDELVRNNLIEEGLAFSDGFLGSAMSHKALWETCVAQKRPIMVLEDDVFLPDSLKDWIGPSLAELRQRCDILYLGYNRDAIVSFGYGGSDWCNIAFEPSPVAFDHEARQHNSWSDRNSHCFVDMRLAWGIIAYMISPRGARLLLDHCFPMTGKIPVRMYGQGRVLIPYGIDGIMNTVIQRGLIKARAVFPPLVIGPNEQADSDNLARPAGPA